MYPARKAANDLKLGQIVNRRAELAIPSDARDKHLYICGATGTGKSKLLEYLIRQDIIDWRKSKRGLMLLDPHGAVYESLIRWLASNPHVKRPVVPIDLRRKDWILSYNVLRTRPAADPGVIASNLVQAIAHVWGQGGVSETPRFAKWATNVMRLLYENGLTLVDAISVLDQELIALRKGWEEQLTDPSVLRDWRFADKLSWDRFDEHVESTSNRLRSFVSTETMRCIFGQDGASLDLGKALREGWIILVNLSTEGNVISKEDAELFARLLLSDLWTAAQERGKKKVKPFYLYVDEFQKFVTPTIAENLDEARGFGLHLTMAHQFPNQLLNAGEHGKKLYDSVVENARSKVAFHVAGEESLRLLGNLLFRSTFNPDEIKHTLYSTKVMGYREEYRKAYSHGNTVTRGESTQTSSGSGESSGGSHGEGSDHATESWNSYFSETYGSSESYSEAETKTESESPMLIPIMGKELSNVQFRDLEEQLFRAMAVLFDQKQRQCVVKIDGVRAPISLFTPTVSEPLIYEDEVEAYIQALYRSLSFALPRAEALQRVKERDMRGHVAGKEKATAGEEPSGSKRRVSGAKKAAKTARRSPE